MKVSSSTDKEKLILLDETDLGNGRKRWASPDVAKKRDLLPAEKIAFDKRQTLLAEKATNAQPTCWEHGCSQAAINWVKEVQFDLKEDKADPLKHGLMTSDHLDGPVPGFCLFHLPQAPAKLAEQVYFSHPMMPWGFQPSRWFVSFTDGTLQGGPIQQINPYKIEYELKEEFIPGPEHGDHQ